MAAPNKGKIAQLERDVKEAVGAVQAMQHELFKLQTQVSAILRQDINAMNGFVINGEAQPQRPF